MKKLLTAILIFALLISTCGLAESEITSVEQLEAMSKDELVDLAAGLLGLETDAPVTAPDTITTLQKGDKSDAVKTLQERLIELDYLSGKADGSYGKGTVNAVKNFQAQNGLEQTGIADEATQQLLYSDDCPAAIVYEDLDYKGDSRDPSNYLGKYVSFSGKVLQVIEGDDDYVAFRIATKGNYDNVVYVAMPIPENYSRILEDDKVIVYGQYADLYSYESVRGDTITIPLIYASSVTLK